MKHPIKVLFSSAGRRVELIECFRKAGAGQNVEVQALAADVNPAVSAACKMADRSFSVPRCTTPDFIPALLQLCVDEGVNLIVPTIDTELTIFAQNRELFSHIGTEIAISSPSTVAIARDKLATHAFLSSIGVPTPRSGRIDDLLANQNNWNFPVILKPIGGSSSIGIQRCDSIDAVRAIDSREHDYIVQEFCSGTEYTVNLFFDRSGLRCSIPHARLETRSGEVSKGVTRRVASLTEISGVLGVALQGEAFGALCFQAIVNEHGAARVFEINARFGGGYPLADFAGARFAEWLLEIVTGKECSADNNWRENVLMVRYDAAVFSENYT